MSLNFQERTTERLEQLNNKVALNILPVIKDLSRRMIFLNAVLWINFLLTAVIMTVFIIWIVFARGEI
jgi:ABC-type transport system involved in Fe-S cluster assembly fused permease/ATPase subunit